MHNKKAQGMPINVIIIVAIALVVLIVLLVIFVNRTRLFPGALKDCATQSGECEYRADCKGAVVPQTKCEEEGKVCCIKFEET